MSTPSQYTRQDAINDNTAASIQSLHREAASQPQTADSSTRQRQTGCERIIQAWESLDPRPKVPRPEEVIEYEEAIETFMYPSAKEDQEAEKQQEDVSQVYASNARFSEVKTAATLKRGAFVYQPDIPSSLQP